MMKRPQKSIAFLSILVTLLLFFAASTLYSQTIDERRTAQKANDLVGQGRYIDALPLLEKVIKAYPSDAEMWAHYGIAIVNNATTMNDVKKRANEYKRGIEALTHAKKLGTNNARALDLLEQFDDSDGSDNFTSDNPAVEKALRQGELHFGKGEYELAFDEYKKAFELDPKNYEAVLFMGDCYYARERYAEAIPYFQQAVDLAPERPTAHLYWADALLFKGEHDRALEKFIDVLILDPFSNISWESFRKWSTVTGVEYDPILIEPPGGSAFGPLQIDPVAVKKADGTDSWLLYTRALTDWKTKPGNSSKRFGVDDEAAAWKMVAADFKKRMSEGTIKTPDRSLVNVVKLYDDGMLKPYLYLVRTRESFEDDYNDVMKTDGMLVRKFIKKYFFNIKEKADIGF